MGAWYREGGLEEEKERKTQRYPHPLTAHSTAQQSHFIKVYPSINLVNRGNPNHKRLNRAVFLMSHNIYSATLVTYIQQ